MLAIVQLSDVFPHVGAPDAGVTLDTHVVTQCQHHLLYLGGQLSCGRQHKRLGLSQLDVDFLQDSDRKCSRLSGSRLSSVESRMGGEGMAGKGMAGEGMAGEGMAGEGMAGKDKWTIFMDKNLLQKLTVQ